MINKSILQSTLAGCVYDAHGSRIEIAWPLLCSGRGAERIGQDNEWVDDGVVPCWLLFAMKIQNEHTGPSIPS